MRYNAQKNCGEVYEKMENFSLAKYHYIQVRLQRPSASLS